MAHEGALICARRQRRREIWAPDTASCAGQWRLTRWLRRNNFTVFEDGHRQHHVTVEVGHVSCRGGHAASNQAIEVDWMTRTITPIFDSIDARVPWCRRDVLNELLDLAIEIA